MQSSLSSRKSQHEAYIKLIWVPRIPVCPGVIRRSTLILGVDRDTASGHTEPWWVPSSEIGDTRITAKLNGISLSVDTEVYYKPVGENRSWFLDLKGVIYHFNCVTAATLSSISQSLAFHSKQIPKWVTPAMIAKRGQHTLPFQMRRIITFL
jgi:hypothetical protein